MYKKTISAAVACFMALQTALTVDLAAQVNVVENPFTPAFRFGDENLPDEYLLAKPEDMWVVDNDGNIYILDEYFIKVFDKEGKPKAIFGGHGQGPGEFSERMDNIFVSEKVT